MKSAHFSLEDVVRPNIFALPKYITSTSDEFQERSRILLDANENSLGACLTAAPSSKPSNGWDESSPNELLSCMFTDSTSLHRYPSASQAQLKRCIADSKSDYGVTKENICLGQGAADLIDLVIRVTCQPGKDAILVTPPNFGLYNVRAALNDVGVVACLLDTTFGLRVGELHKELTLHPNIKLVFLASPGNPTGTLISLDDVQAILDFPAFKGLVVVDEAYIDYSRSPDRDTALNLLSQYANLIVLQTFSKSPGLAGIRLGIAYANPATIGMLEKLQMPYCISTPVSILAQASLSSDSRRQQEKLVSQLISNREALVRAVTAPGMADLGVGRPLGGGDANFIVIPLLCRVSHQLDKTRAQKAVRILREGYGIAVRYIGEMPHCEASLRVTVGTESENNEFVEALRKALTTI